MVGKIDDSGSLTVSFKGLQQESLGTLIQQVSVDKQFVLLGDSDHSNASLIMSILNPDTINTMAQADIKHLCFEITRSAQPIIDDYYSGKKSYEEMKNILFVDFGTPYLTPEENKTLGNAYAEMVRSAKEAGIKVHFVDGEAVSDEEDAKMKSDHPMYALYDAVTVMNGEERDRYFLEREKIEPGITEKYNTYVENMLNRRYDFDLNIIEDMQEMAKDGKVAIFYGEAHFSRAPHFIPKLRDEAVYIGLRGSQRDIEGVGDTHLPDYVFYTELEANGKTLQAAGKIEAPDRISDVCKIALDASKGFMNILACVDESHQWGAAPLTPAAAAPAKTVGGPS